MLNIKFKNLYTNSSLQRHLCETKASSNYMRKSLCILDSSCVYFLKIFKDNSRFMFFNPTFKRPKI